MWCLMNIIPIVLLVRALQNFERESRYAANKAYHVYMPFTREFATYLLSVYPVPQPNQSIL